METLPPVLASALQTLDPSATFSGRVPRIASSSGRTYYAKIGRTSDLEQFAGEAACLKIFSAISPGIAPNVLSYDIDKNTGEPYMISDYLDIGTRLNEKSARALAKRLALEVHGHTSENGMFGFDVPTFCGATRFDNKWCETWDKAFGGMIESLLERIESGGGGDSELFRLGKQVVHRVIPHLLGERLDAKPSFLHGDLWSGNVGTLADGSPVIYDPSSYFGHNEADLAIARMFGGFPSSFFSTYHEHRPKSTPVEEYERRLELYELFHYLNHTLLFGHGYAAQSKTIMRGLLTFAETEGI